MSDGNSILKNLSEKLSEWDAELAKFRSRAQEVASERKGQFDNVQEEVKKQAAHVKAKVEELKNKSPDELKEEARELMQMASGKIADGLRSLSDFFESKSGGGDAGSRPGDGPKS